MEIRKYLLENERPSFLPKRKMSFEKSARLKEREALIRAVAISKVQQALARKQMDELKAALKGLK